MDAGQVVERQFVRLVRDEVEQPHRLRRGIVAADARAFGFLFLVARFGDEMLQLAVAALVVTLRRGDHEQVARIWRQRGADDVDLVTEPERRGRARGVALAERLVVFAFRVTIGLDVAQGREQAQLQAAEVVGLLRLRILFRLDDCGGAADAAREIVLEPVRADPVLHRAAVGGELRRGFGFGRARELDQATARDFAHEYVAVAHECGARAVAIEHRVRAVRIRHRGRIDQGVRAAGEIDAMQVADRVTVLLDAVIDRAAVDAPVRRFDRCADPVRIGHRLFDGHRARGCCEAGQQGNATGDDQAVHGDSGHWATAEAYPTRPAEPPATSPAKAKTVRQTPRSCRNRP